MIGIIASRNLKLAPAWAGAAIRLDWYCNAKRPRGETVAFDPFFTTKAPNKGAGLGLSASYGIIDDMGGQITVANSASGARFTIRLPLIAQA
jgi:nitrogen fixation/metabolism regulation signal transduction histidine kinase